MPSLDIVSKVDMHEVTNAVDQANREVSNRFDFKGIDARFEHTDGVITLQAEVEFQLNQMMDILRQKLTKRGVDAACMDIGDPETSLNAARQAVTLRQGLDAPLAKQIAKMIKNSKLKVQTAIQGEQVRVSGKKRDDLQKIIALLKKADVDRPLQFINFRD